jgi:hypothetical protein
MISMLLVVSKGMEVSNNGYDGGGKGDLSGEALENAKGDFAFSERDIVSGDLNEITGKFEATHQK